LPTPEEGRDDTMANLAAAHAVYGMDAEVRVLDIVEILAVSAGIVDEEILDSYYIPED